MAQLGARLDGIEEVVGSNPIGSTKSAAYSPERSFTERCGDIVYTLGPKVSVNPKNRSVVYR